MKQTILLRTAGIISLVFTAFHLAFPLMPNWEFAIKSMPDDYGDIFITYHYGSTAFIGFMAFISTFRTHKLLQSAIRNEVLLMFSSLYVIRTVTEFTLWGITFPQAAIILPLCIIPAFCYLSVAFKKPVIRLSKI